MQLLNLLGELDNLLTTKYKGGPNSGNHGHAGIPGKRGGSASKGYSVAGTYLGEPIYEIKNSIPKDVLSNRAPKFMLSPEGKLYAWRQGDSHAQIVHEVLNDGGNFDKYIRVETKNFKGEKFLGYDSAYAGAGPINLNNKFDSMQGDIGAERNFKKISRRLVSAGMPKNTVVSWYNSNGVSKSTLGDWV